MRRYFTRRRLAIGGLALAGLAAGLYWGSLPHVTSTHRALLVGHRHDSQYYLRDQAQSFATCPTAATETYHARFNEPSGDLQMELYDGSCVHDSWVELDPVGTSHDYHTHTNIPGKGQDRTSWGFTYASAEYVQAGAAATNNLTTEDFTLSAIVLYTDPGGAPTPRIVSKIQGAGGGGYEMYFDPGANRVYCQLKDPGGWYASFYAFDLEDNNVHKIDCVLDTGADTITTYVDGVAGTPVSTAGMASITSTDLFTVGTYPSGPVPRYWNGAIYEVRLTTSILSTAQLVAEYRQILTDGEYLTDDANIVAHYRFNELSTTDGLIDYSGNGNHLTTVNGTPDVQYVSPPFPMGTGFTRRGIFLSGVVGASSAYYTATAQPVVADQTTNDINASFWINPRECGRWGQNGVISYLVSKTDATNGYAIKLTTSCEIEIRVTNGGVDTDGVVSTGIVDPNEWHFVTVNFDRDGNAYTYIDSVDTGVTTDISTKQGSLTNAAVLFVNDYGPLAAFGPHVTWAELTISDGLTTLAEHQEMYKAFVIPSGITHAQTTNWKWPLTTENEFGERLGLYAGSATNPQWPIGYAATAEDAAKNPLGTGFPGHEAITNVLGFPNEFESWTRGGGMIAGDILTNESEAPDGTITAEQVTFNTGETLTRAVVGGGNITAGETWGASLWYRFISGASCDVRMYNGTTEYNTLGSADTEWHKIAQASQQAGEAKQIQLDANTATNCVYDLSDAQYTGNDNDVPGQCTNCTGAANCTCNASYYSQSWLARETYMPASYERMEIDAFAALAPTMHDMTTKRTLWQLGDYASLNEGSQLNLQLSNTGGGIEALVTGKPLTIIEEYREYVVGWNVKDGLTNTSPVKYASLQLNGEYQQTILDSRQNDSTIDIVEPPSKTDLNTYDLYVGCDSAGANCANAIIPRVQAYARPATQVVADDDSHLITANYTGPAWLSTATPRFHCFGVDATDCWILDMGDYSGSIYDRSNGVAFAATGAPDYQIFSGLIGRGQGRRGINFDGTNEHVQAPSTSECDFGAASSGVSIEALVSLGSVTGTQAIISSTDAAGGYRMYLSGTSVICSIEDNVAGMFTLTEAAAVSAADIGKVHAIVCTFTWGGAAWTGDMYMDGVSVTPASAGAAVQNITNSQALTIGTDPDASDDYDGEVYEARIANVVYSAADVLAHYQQTVQNGTYLSSDANTLCHYKLNESTVTNGIGVNDSSGNGDHLTVVGATPDPQYRDMPWPGGSGVTKSAVGIDDTAEYFSGSTIAPNAANPFSMVAWVRSTGSVNTKDIIDKQGANPVYRMHIDATDHIVCTFTDAVPATATATSVATTLSNEQWHLVACKLSYSAPNYTAEVSVNGGAFAAGTSIAGTITGNANAIRIGELANAADSVQVAGVAILKDYEITDADVATLWTLGTDPNGLLTYARTATNVKGMCTESVIDPLQGVGVTCFADNQIPYAQYSDLQYLPGNSRMRLGIQVHSEVENLALRSEDSANVWANNNTADVVDQAFAPDGTYTADEITATAANGDIRQVFGAIAATSHTYCQYLKRNQATDVPGFLRVITNSTHAVIASQAFTATSAWQRFCVTGTATLNDTRVETEITTDTEVIFWWGAMMTETSGWPDLYCPTGAASSTCNTPTSIYIPAASMTDWSRSEGIVFNTGLSNLVNAAGSYMYYHLYNGVDASNQIIAYNVTGVNDVVGIADNAGVTQQTPVTTGEISGVRLNGIMTTYDSQGVIYGTRRSYAQHYHSTYPGPFMVYSIDTGANWTMAGGTDMWIGIAGDGTFPIDGYYGTLDIWHTR